MHPGAGWPFCFVLTGLFLPKNAVSFGGSPAVLRVCPNAQPSLGPFLFRARSKVIQRKKRKKTENPEKTQPWCCVSDGQPSLTPIGHHVPEMSRAVGQSAAMWGSVFGKGGSCWAVGAAETLRDGGRTRWGQRPLGHILGIPCCCAQTQQCAAAGIASPVGVSCDVRAGSFKWAECPRCAVRWDGGAAPRGGRTAAIPTAE